MMALLEMHREMVSVHEMLVACGATVMRRACDEVRPQVLFAPEVDITVRTDAMKARVAFVLLKRTQTSIGSVASAAIYH